MTRSAVARTSRPGLFASLIVKPGTGRMPVLLVALLSSVIHAQTITLPLEGYFRPGAYMPAWVQSGGSVTITSDGAVTTQFQGGASLAPIFVYSAVADQLRCGDQVDRLHALADDDRLVGCTTHDDLLLAQLFPSKHLITIDLNTSNELTGPPLAWDSLDAALVNWIAPQKIAPLLATGMILAVRSDDKPDNIRPWKRVADAWVLRPPTHDQPSLLGEEAYAPTFSWHAERSRAVRQFIVIVAILTACLMLSMALWRSRWNLIALSGLVVLFSSVFVAVRIKQPDVMTKSRDDRIVGDVTQLDHWDYQMSPAAIESHISSDGITWPVFASPSHAESLHLVTEFDPLTNVVHFRFTLPANARIAFDSRAISP